MASMRPPSTNRPITAPDKIRPSNSDFIHLTLKPHRFKVTKTAVQPRKIPRRLSYGPTSSWQRESVKWNQSHHDLPADSILLQAERPQDSCVPAPSSEPATRSSLTENLLSYYRILALPVGLGFSGRAPLPTFFQRHLRSAMDDPRLSRMMGKLEEISFCLRPGILQWGVSDINQEYDIHVLFYRSFNALLSLAGDSKIRNLQAEGKVMYDYIPTPDVPGFDKAGYIYQEMTARNPPIFIHYTLNERFAYGYWLIPAVQASSKCPSLLAYLMWRLEQRWIILGFGTRSHQGAILVYGLLTHSECMSVQRYEFPPSLACFGEFGSPKNLGIYEDSRVNIERKTPNISPKSSAPKISSPLASRPVLVPDDDVPDVHQMNEEQNGQTIKDHTEQTVEEQIEVERRKEIREGKKPEPREPEPKKPEPKKPEPKKPEPKKPEPKKPEPKKRGRKPNKRQRTE